MKKCPGRQTIEGVACYLPSESHFGFTLITHYSSKTIKLINMQGTTVKEWHIDYLPVEARLIDNGNLQVMCRDESGPLASLEGAGGILQEIDPDGKVVWEYKNPYMHHRADRLENGNTLILKWVEVPVETAAKVAGGFDKDDSDGQMWGDAILEIDRDGNVVWEWNSHEHLDPEKDDICPLCSKTEWGHATCIEAVSDDKIFVNFMRISQIGLIDKRTGNFDWKWGTKIHNGEKVNEINHQTYATMLEDGSVCIFDNGRHLRGEALNYSRVVVIDPKTGNILAGYEEDPPSFMFSSFLGNAQKLDNGGLLVVEGTRGHIMELNYRNSVVWEYVTPDWGKDPVYGENNWIISAYRYSLNEDSLKKCLDVNTTWRSWLEVAKESYLVGREEEDQPSQPQMSSADIIRNRLENLGY
ncbi:MAG: aryl-sulfate sulfotransferase [Candidatus Marinimicrobia bacterium]|nr:aryl-sulfate sulfotransferase [Candidatus Neomarinimicrobiota bacterium]